MRRLWAQDKSGAGDSSAVSMEERETEEVGGSSKKNTATISVASLPPCIGVKNKLSLLSVHLLSLPTSLTPGEGFPRRGTLRGKGAGVPLCGGDSMGEGQTVISKEKKKGQGQRIKRGSPASPPKMAR